MRMRIALSALVTAIAVVVTIGSNVTAASADTSSISFAYDYYCC
ncbi:hypothetical protein [Nonomuraea bangladeshensis]